MGTNDSPHVARNSGSVEWYTPSKYIESARKVLNGIYLDPASCKEANETVQAHIYYNKEDDGLLFPWAGTVWMNPPYSRGLVDKFCGKFVDHYLVGDIEAGIVLVNNATDTEWFHALASVCTALCFPSSRISFNSPHRAGSRSPRQGQAFLYFGADMENFIFRFRKYGVVFKK